MVYRGYGQACSGPCLGESCNVWATSFTKQCNRSLSHMHLYVQKLLSAGVRFAQHCTHACHICWYVRLTAFSWSKPPRRVSLAQGFDQNSLDHTSVSDVRPDCSSTRTRPAKRSLTDHINGRFCISKPLSVTDTRKSHCLSQPPGLVTTKA